jgi:hypothetical protein
VASQEELGSMEISSYRPSSPSVDRIYNGKGQDVSGSKIPSIKKMAFSKVTRQQSILLRLSGHE